METSTELVDINVLKEIPRDKRGRATSNRTVSRKLQKSDQRILDIES